MIEYSICKGVYSRRKLEIPNPKQYLDLSQAIVDNWKIINDTYKISSYSESKPVLHKAKRSIKQKVNLGITLSLNLLKNHLTENLNSKLIFQIFIRLYILIQYLGAYLVKLMQKSISKLKIQNPPNGLHY